MTLGKMSDSDMYKSASVHHTVEYLFLPPPCTLLKMSFSYGSYNLLRVSSVPDTVVSPEFVSFILCGWSENSEILPSFFFRYVLIRTIEPHSRFALDLNGRPSLLPNKFSCILKVS